MSIGREKNPLNKYATALNFLFTHTLLGKLALQSGAALRRAVIAMTFRK